MSSVRTHVTLDGPWTVALDAENKGVEAKWFSTPPAGTDIQLPSMQEQGIAKGNCAGWFFKSFEQEESIPGKFAELHFASVNYPGEFWLNGTRLGSHPGGGAPADFPATAHLRTGSNTLAVRIDASQDFRETAQVLRYRYPLDTPGDVTLHLRPKAYIESVYIQPDVRRKRIAVAVEAPADCTLNVQIEGTPYHVQGAPGELILEFPEFEPWSPDTPRLYTLRADLTAADGSLDSVATAFGMREFTVKDERFYLNNRPHYLKSTAYEPHYPATLRSDKLEALLAREVDLAKSAGFNALHITGGPAPAALYRMASETGLLLIQDVPDHGDDGTASASAIASALANHAALAAWCVPAGAADDTAPALRTQDPSRLILWRGTHKTTAGFMRPYRDTPETFEIFESFFPVPLGPIARDYLRLEGDPNAMNLEIGLGAPGATSWNTGGSDGGGRQAAFEAEYSRRQLDRCFSSPEKFFEASQLLQADAIRAQLDAARSNARLVGYVAGRLCDGPASAPFGLADARRVGKPALKSLKQVQQEIRPVIQMQKYNLTPREEVGVTILLINEARIEGRGELSLQVVGPTNQVLWKKKRLVKIPRHGRELWTGEIAASGSPGPHRFVVRLMQDRRVVGENSVNLHVVQPVSAEPVEVYVPGGRSPVRAACGRLAKLGNVLAPVHVVPPLANTIRAYPADDLMQVFAHVAEGAVAIVFQPPADWNELAEMVDKTLEIHTRPVVGRGVVAHHYAKLHPVFDGLPSRDLMKQPYQNLLPLHAFESESDEEMCGTHCQFPRGESWWGANIIVRRFGAGRVVFTHLRILDHLGTDPVANRLFQNLLLHFSRRSVPSTEVVGGDQKSVEWLNQERIGELRKWMLLGTFPNWGGKAGYDAILPPERGVDLDATYPGWYRAIRWKPWWTRQTAGHRIDFHAALDADSGLGAPCRYGAAFAYAEFSCDRRDEVFLNVLVEGGVKVWLNGAEVIASGGGTSDAEKNGTGWVKQGKNTLLLKVAKQTGSYDTTFTLEPLSGAPLIVNWWK